MRLQFPNNDVDTNNVYTINHFPFSQLRWNTEITIINFKNKVILKEDPP